MFDKENLKNIKWPLSWFIVIFIILTVAMQYYFMSFTGHDKDVTHWQEIGNYVSSTVAIAVGFAGSLVAIALAIIALKQAESTNRLTEKIAKDEEFNALKERITEKVSTTVKNNHEIMSAYYEVSFNMYEYVVWLFDKTAKTVNYTILELAIKNKSGNALTPFEAEILKTSDAHLRSIQKRLDCFSDAIATLEQDLFTRQAYQNKYLAYKLPLRDFGKMPDNFYTDVENEIAYFRLQIKKFASRYASSDDILSIINLILNNVEWLHSNQNFQKDYFTSIMLGYCIAPLNKDGDTLLLGGILFYEILLNLPNGKDLKEVLIALEAISKEADDQEEISKYIAQIVDNIFKNQNYFDGFRVDMKKQAELIQNNFIHHIQFQKFDFKQLFYVAKAVAIRDGESIITMDIIEEATRYVVFDNEDNLCAKYNFTFNYEKMEMDYKEVDRAKKEPIIPNDSFVKSLYIQMQNDENIRLRHYWNYDLKDLDIKSRWVHC